MKYTQIYDFVNKVNKLAWGVNAIEVVDTTGLIATGEQVFSTAANTDIWMQKCPDVLYDQFIANRKRKTKTYSNIYKTNHEYGAYMEKIVVKVPDAIEESAWKLQNGQVLNNPKAAFPDVNVNLYQSNNVYRFDITLPVDQLKSAFMSEDKFAAFIAAIALEMENKIDATAANVARICVNNFIAEKYDYATKHVGEGIHAVNLLADYNAKTSQTLTIAQAMRNEDFLRESAATMMKYINRMADDSTVFNINQINRQTDKDHLNLIVHSEYIQNLNTYLKSSTFHDNLVGELGAAYDETNFWQASGKTYDFATTSKIEMTTSGGTSVTIPCVIGFAFDVDALGFTWDYKKVRNFYSPEYDVNHQIHSIGTGMFNDYGNENGIVFYMSES